MGMREKKDDVREDKEIGRNKDEKLKKLKKVQTDERLLATGRIREKVG